MASLDMPTVWFWPNPDAGTGEMAERLRHFRERTGARRSRCGSSPTCRWTSSSRCCKVTACLVGNSSAGIKECSYLGTPVVNIGARQQGRLHAANVAHVGYDRDAIASAVAAADRARALSARRTSTTAPAPARRSSKLLAGVELYTQKRFCDNTEASVRTVMADQQR